MATNVRSWQILDLILTLAIFILSLFQVVNQGDQTNPGGQNIQTDAFSEAYGVSSLFDNNGHFTNPWNAHRQIDFMIQNSKRDSSNQIPPKSTETSKYLNT